MYDCETTENRKLNYFNRDDVKDALHAKVDKIFDLC